MSEAISLFQVDVNKGCLPSPEDLKYKILIKAKRSKKVDKEEKTGSKGESDPEQENPTSGPSFKSPFEQTMKLARRISVVVSRGGSPDNISGKDNESLPDKENPPVKENALNDEDVHCDDDAEWSPRGPRQLQRLPT